MAWAKGMPYPKAQKHASLYDGEKLQGVLNGWKIDLWGQGVQTAKYKVREVDRCVCHDKKNLSQKIMVKHRRFFSRKNLPLVGEEWIFTAL